MAKAQPSDLELQVLTVLWQAGPSAVRRVLEAIPDGKKRSYTTILSVLQVMETKGLVTHTSKGRAYIYKPAVTRKQVLGPLLRSMVNKVFGGSTSQAVQQLLNETTVRDDELSQIRTFLKQVKTDSKQQRQSPKKPKRRRR